MSEAAYNFRDRPPLWESYAGDRCRLLFWNYSRRAFTMLVFERDVEECCWREVDEIPFKPFEDREEFGRICAEG